MTPTEINDLAFTYVESKDLTKLNSHIFHDAFIFYYNKVGNVNEYAVFINLAYMWLKNKVDLIMSDIYLNASNNEPV